MSQNPCNWSNDWAPPRNWVPPNYVPPNHVPPQTPSYQAPSYPVTNNNGYSLRNRFVTRKESQETSETLKNEIAEFKLEKITNLVKGILSTLDNFPINEMSSSTSTFYKNTLRRYLFELLKLGYIQENDFNKNFPLDFVVAEANLFLIKAAAAGVY